MTRIALAAALVLAAGCASPPEALAAPAAFSVEVRIVPLEGDAVIAPRLTVFSGQRANVQVLRRESYVQSFEREGDGAVVDPVVGTVQGGILLDARTSPLADGSGARFDFRLTAMEPRKPFEERSIDLAPGTSFTIQLPEVARVEVEGSACLPDGEERAVAVLPWPGAEGGAVTVFVRIRAASMPEGEDPFGDGSFALEEYVNPPPPAPGPPVAAGRPGWFRLRSVHLAKEREQGTVIEGGDLASLLEGDGLTVGRDLQWAGSGDGPAHAGAVADRSLLTDFDVETGMGGTWIRGPILQQFTFGLLADRDPTGGFRCTLSSLMPLERFTTSLGSGPPVTIDLPEIRIRSGRLEQGAGDRLLVLGSREGGGSEGVVLSFRPGAVGPEK